MKPNELAFPSDSNCRQVLGGHRGLTKRDYIAIEAMAALLTHRGLVIGGMGYEESITADHAYLMADAMIKAGTE